MIFNKPLLFTSVCFLSLIMFVSTSYAKSIFVATTGMDSNNSLTITTPVLTIQKAVNIAAPGDTIFIRGGTYAGANIRVPGTANNWITMKPYNNEKVIIDGDLTNRQFTIYFYHDSCDPYDPTYIVPCQAAYWELQGLEIRGGSIYVVKIDQRWVRIINNNIYGSKADLIKIVKTGDDVIIDGNTLHDNNAINGANAQAIDIVGADRVHVVNNYIYNIPSVGMFAKGNARNAIFEKNLLIDIYDRGIMLGQSTNVKSLVDGPYECYDCIAKNNIVINAGSSCFGLSGALNAKIYNNSCFNVAQDRQAGIFFSRESEIGTRNCNVEIKNNIIHVSSKTKRPVVKIGFRGMHDGTTIGTDLVERCPTGYDSLAISNNIYWNTSNNSSSITFIWDDIGLYSPKSFEIWKTKTGQDINTLLVDPLFKDTNTSDFSLQENSPAIDSGINGLTTSDLNNNPRPIDGNGDNISTADIGAHEYVPFDVIRTSLPPLAPTGFVIRRR